MRQDLWTEEKFVQRAKEVHGSRYDYSLSEMNGAHCKIKIICKEHGIFEQTIAAHIKLEQGCKYCAREKVKDRYVDCKVDFIDKAQKVHGMRYDYTETIYEKSCIKIKIICPDHGEFSVTPNNHLKGKSCGKCIPGGFQPNFPGYVYVLKSENKVKIGITNKEPQVRVDYINLKSKKDKFKLVHASFYEDGNVAKNIEKEMLSYFRKRFKTDNTDKFNGYTECFTGLEVQEVLNKLEELS